MSAVLDPCATVYFWKHTDKAGKVSSGADVVCGPCQLLKSVIVDYSKCERREVSLEADGILRVVKPGLGEKRYRYVQCHLCGTIVAEEEQ